MARILIVDDTQIMRRTLRQILEQAGHEVVAEASNGKEAVSLYTKLKPDIVTMDISMPEMQGVEALKNIIAFDKDAIVIMISAIAQTDQVLEAIDQGAKHYIIKPINMENVMKIINKFVS